MSDLDRNYTSPFGRVAGRADAATIDAGLRAYMLRIYNYMASPSPAWPRSASTWRR
jgi:hypothetical protein